jgi:hypothetical protein
MRVKYEESAESWKKKHEPFCIAADKAFCNSNCASNYVNDQLNKTQHD